MRLVVDANVLVKTVLPEEWSEEARLLAAKIGEGEILAIAPQIFVAEVGHRLRREVLAKRLERKDADELWADINALPVEFHPLPELAQAAWELSLAHMGRFYDALYVALAIREGVSVVTADEKLIGAFAPLGRATHLADFKL